MIVHNGNIVVNNGRWINCSQPYSIKRHINILSTPGGTIIAEPVEGYDGYVVKLSHTDNPYYIFMNYNVSGARLYNDRYFRFEGSDVTVSGTWQFSTQWLCDNWVKIGDQIWTSKNLEIDDGGTGIYRVDNVTTPGGTNFGTQYYYTPEAAKRIADTIPGWSIPRNGKGSINGIGYKLSWYLLSFNSANTLKSTYGWEMGTNGDNSTGFNALPVGYYNIHDNRVVGIGTNSGWLSTDQDGNIHSVYSGYNYVATIQWDYTCINDSGGSYYPSTQSNWYTSVRLVKNDSNPPVCV